MTPKGFRQTFFFSAIVCYGCFPYQKRIDIYRESVERQFPEASRFVVVDQRRMHYMRTGSGPNLVVFIHGSPGTWDAFAEYLANATLLESARLVAVDRFGFGKSEPAHAEKSLATQCLFISQIIKTESAGLHNPRVFVVGHSFGGPIAARLAADGANGVTDILLLAPSVDPDLEKIAWYQSVADWPPVRWLLPRQIDNTNQEILALRGELLALKPLWTKIRARTTVVHGIEDRLVPVANVDFIQTMLRHNKPKVALLQEQGHFIPWEKSALVIEILARAIKI